MLPAMREPWEPKDSRLYQYADGNGSVFLSAKLADTIQIDLMQNQSYAFLRDHAEFDDLISEVKDIISSSPQPPTE